ncbi:hypothetical protein [Brevundimonas denitrificans]|uniref:hypothetical protein n=1 Tax=Brevundimonas denitrificans TaxID=1443434 RepID=UPI00223B9BC2|nr:hypothetical protein [Brevundimonas denitrificans]
MRAAGLRSLSPSPWFAPVSVERLLLEPRRGSSWPFMSRCGPTGAGRGGIRPFGG